MKIGHGLLGPQGAFERMREIESRIESLSPTPQFQSFGSALSGAIAGLGPADVGQLDVSPLEAMAKDAAVKNGVDPDIFASLVKTESDWNPRALSSKGAMGLTQLMPDTAAGLGLTDPYDAAQNLGAGAKYLRQMLDRFGGNYTKALAAYNAGPAAVEKANGMPPYPETMSYVKQILGRVTPKP